MTVVSLPSPTDRPQSPSWWVSRLYRQIADRRAEIDFFTAYYRGDAPLPWLAPQARSEFRRILRMTRTNYMGLVCDATAERVSVQGVRFGKESEADDDTWRIWQANGLDADADKAILEALINGSSYLLVAPNPDDGATPYMWVEHPSQAVVEYLPGSNRRVRAAGLKVWDDDWSGEVHATLYLPDAIFKYRTSRPQSGYASVSPEWSPRTVRGESWPAVNPLGEVPLVEIPNNPLLLSGGVSELSDVTDIQDRINKTVADRLITQDYGAFPQKWATAWPNEDESGNPIPQIDVGRNRMVTTEVAETKFGQWEAAALDPYSFAKREDVKDIASRTRTPAQYLLGEMSNVNGETLKASESGLVSKVYQRRRGYSEGFKSAVAMVRVLAGLPVVEAADMEIMYTNPEFRTEGELSDATVKKLQAGIISKRQAREDLGYTATQISRMEDEDAAEATDPLIADILRQSSTPPAEPSGPPPLGV